MGCAEDYLPIGTTSRERLSERDFVVPERTTFELAEEVETGRLSEI
jgi:hypothetical protein